MKIRLPVILLFVALIGGCAGQAQQNLASSPQNRPLMQDGPICCSGQGETCGTCESDKQVVYIDRPVEEFTKSVRVHYQSDGCTQCATYPVSVREKGRASN